MHPEAREELRIRFKLAVLEYAKHFGATETCREFNIARSNLYEWKQKYHREGRAGLSRQQPVAYRHPRKTSLEVVEKILELRRGYQIGALRIAYYLNRYHGIKISESTVTQVLRDHGVARRAIHSKRYAKSAPGHHVQLDVKFVQLKDQAGQAVKRYQYTAIDDATRIRALQIFSKHNQDCAI